MATRKGNFGYNQRLSERRARRVASILEGGGVRADRIRIVVGTGESESVSVEEDADFDRAVILEITQRPEPTSNIRLPRGGESLRPLESTVANLLMNSITSSIRFRVETDRGFELRYSGALLAQVAQAINDRRIQVRIDQRLGPSQNALAALISPAQLFAAYNNREDTFFLADGQVNTVAREALIVHEAVHALNDLRSSPQIVGDDESAAYVAQAMYLLRSGMTAPAILALVGRTDIHIFSNAVNIALQVLRGRTPNRREWIQLVTAIGAHPAYRGRLHSVVSYNGLRRRPEGEAGR